MDDMHARICATLLMAAHKHNGLNAVGMAERCWMTKEINDKLKYGEEVRRSGSIHIEAYNSLNEEVSRLTTVLKRGIWQRNVQEGKE